MKIIIDTNLWISFLIGKKLSTLKALLTNKNVEIYVCDELIAEFKDVAFRDKFKKYISFEDVNATLKLFDVYCTHIRITGTAKSPVRDAKDLYLLSLADSLLADYILTGDKDLLVLEKHNQTVITTFSDFSSHL